MLSARSIHLITRAVLTLSFVVAFLVESPVGFAQTTADGQGKVKVEWLGHEFYLLTSPKGVVVITSPWLANPDGPVPLDSLARTDFILVPNAHNDDMGTSVMSGLEPRMAMMEKRFRVSRHRKSTKENPGASLLRGFCFRL